MSRLSVPLSVAALILYLMAFMALMLAVVPHEALALVTSDPKPIQSRVALGVAAVFLGFGGACQLALVRTGRDRISPRAFRFGLLGSMGIVLGWMGLSYGLMTWTGLPAPILKTRFDRVFGWVIGAIGVGGSLLIAVGVGGLVWIHRNDPGNRMARRLAAGDLDGAIAIGEGLPPDQRSLVVQANLVVAYHTANRRSEARSALDDLENGRTKAENLPDEQRQTTLAYLRGLLDGVEPGPAGPGPGQEGRSDHDTTADPGHPR